MDLQSNNVYDVDKPGGLNYKIYISNGTKYLHTISNSDISLETQLCKFCFLLFK